MGTCEEEAAVTDFEEVDDTEEEEFVEFTAEQCRTPDEYLEFAALECNGIPMHRLPTMGELSDNLKQLRHPTRNDEVVGTWSYADMVFRFTPDFVKECFETAKASKNGENPLRDFMMKHFPRC